MLNTLLFAGRLLFRQIRRGEWLIVLFALIISIAALSALNIYIDRLSRGIEQQSSQFLGGDLVISSATPIPNAWVSKANQFNLQTAQIWTYPTVTSANDKLQLTSIQAVSKQYPLLNKQTTKPELNTVWVEPRLLNALSLKINDYLHIGSASFRISNIITNDMDMPNTGLSIAPTALINLSDIAKTQTVLPGSRVDYRLLIVGKKKSIEQFTTWIKPQLTPSQRLIDIYNQQIASSNILKQANQYLLLILLICMCMSGIIIALNIRYYLQRHFRDIALWKAIGTNEKQISLIFFWKLFLIALIAALIGTTLGFSLEYFFSQLFSEYFRFTMPHARIYPALISIILSIIILFSFAYPLITQAPKFSPLLLWHDENFKIMHYGNKYVIIILIAFFSFLILTLGYSLLILLFIDIILLSVGFLLLFNQFLFALIKMIINHTTGTMRRGLSQIIHHPELSNLQITSVSLIIISLIILANVKNDLLNQWQQNLPKNTPNFFAFNIDATNLDELKKYLISEDINIDGIYPMVRGRLTMLNNKPILSAIPENSRNHNALRRELNLSWMWEFPADNNVISGGNWKKQASGKTWVSVESSLAQQLNLNVGDQLTLQIGDRTISATIYNIRDLKWSSFHPNFYIIFTPGVLDNFNATYITSFYLPENKKNVANTIIEKFPNISIIDVAHLLKQIQTLVAKIVAAIQYLFLFALALSILILIASLQASLDERKKIYQLLFTLGASQNYIIKCILVEFISLSLLIFIPSIILGKIASIIIMHGLNNIV